MATRGEETAQLLEALGGMVQTFVDRAHELGVGVTAEQLATNVLPQLGRVAGDMLAHHKVHGSLDGVRLELVPATAIAEQTDEDIDEAGV